MKTILIGLLPHMAEDLERTFVYSLDDEQGIGKLWDELDELDYLQDPTDEFRSGEVETEIKSEWSRHYETKSVAAQMFDGSWAGWTYWYGGGKHAEPSAIDWMGGSYNLNCKEEEKLVIVRTFEKVLDKT